MIDGVFLEEVVFDFSVANEDGREKSIGGIASINSGTIRNSGVIGGVVTFENIDEEVDSFGGLVGTAKEASLIENSFATGLNVTMTDRRSKISRWITGGNQYS